MLYLRNFGKLSRNVRTYIKVFWNEPVSNIRSRFVLFVFFFVCQHRGRTHMRSHVRDKSCYRRGPNIISLVIGRKFHKLYSLLKIALIHFLNTPWATFVNMLPFNPGCKVLWRIRSLKSFQYIWSFCTGGSSSWLSVKICILTEITQERNTLQHQEHLP